MRIVTCFLCAVMLCLAACADRSAPETLNPTPVMAQIETVRMGVILHQEPEEHLQEVEDEINRLLLEEAGAPLRLEFVIVPGANGVNDTVNFTHSVIRDSNQHTFDIFPDYRAGQDNALLVEEGVALDISDYLTYYPDLFAMNDDEVWREATIDERIWWFPVVDEPVGRYERVYHDLEVEQSLLDRLNAAFPKTLEEMTAILRELKARDLPHKLMCPVIGPPLALHRTYEEWPFFVDRDSLFIYYADGGMEPYINSEVFKRDAAILKELDAEGLILWYDLFTEGLQNTTDRGVAMSANSSRAYLYGSDTIKSGLLEPDRSGVRVSPLATGAIFVSTQCEAPETAIAMINAIYTNDKIALTLAYGIEGKDWLIREDGAFEQVGNNFARRALYHYQNALPYMSAQEFADMELYQEESYPFSGFRFSYYDFITSEGPYPLLEERLQEAIDRIYDLRRGVIPMIELDAVKQSLFENGFGTLLEQTQARYDRYKQR